MGKMAEMLPTFLGCLKGTGHRPGVKKAGVTESPAAPADVVQNELEGLVKGARSVCVEKESCCCSMTPQGSPGKISCRVVC